MVRAFVLLLLSLSLLGAAAPFHGTADLCVFRNGLFLCDTAHDGGTSEMRFRFGRAGDVPFLIPSTVDGQALPCVFRDHRFLCGAGERLLVVPPGAQPLMGDVDGDLAQGGTVDPCYRQGRVWTCLVFEEPVGFRQMSFTFGSGSGTGLLGDLDGDGLADLCMFRRGQLICEMFRPRLGRFVQASFDLRPEFNRLGGGTPLLGDVDGDGRADPCLYAHGRLICGIFAPGQQRPARTIEESFGVEGDIPVLGDVDGL
jgi:hypothetical protein